MRQSGTLEQELAELVEHGGYDVSFQHAGSFGWFYVRVFFDGKLVAEKACCKSYPKASRWAKRQVRRHQRGLRHLGGLHRA